MLQNNFFQKPEYDKFNITLLLKDSDLKFGFSVVGGFDEGVKPNIDDITFG